MPQHAERDFETLRGAMHVGPLAAAVSISQDPQRTIDDALNALAMTKDAWIKTSVAERIALLDEVGRDVMALAERWVSAGMAAKGIAPGSYAEGEEWIFFGIFLRSIRLLRTSLSDLQRHGRPRIPGPMTMLANGQVSARVMPQTPIDRVLFPGTTAEVWMDPAVSVPDVLDAQAQVYRQGPRTGKIALVLGAGNTSMLVPGDCLHKLFAEDQVVILKPNPVNAYLGPLLEEGLGALIRRGVLRIVYGGADEGAMLSHHPLVDEIHMTGSDKTFEAIVFGSGPDGAYRKERRQPVLRKRFTAELGNVTPVIVVPGPWSASDVRDQAGQLATWLVNNAGFQCLTPRVLIQHRGWAERHPFLGALRASLMQVPPRKAYYPGAAERFERFITAHPRAWQIGRNDPGELPWTLITDLDPGATSDICFRCEAFCSIYGETAIEAPSISDYLERAVNFANSTLWGSLTVTLVVHPRSLKDPEVRTAVERAIGKLRYGTVLVNQYGGFAYYLGLTPWGASPGHSIYDIQSGTGWVNNYLFFERPQKSVVRAPFRKAPNPLSLASRHFPTFGRRLAGFEAHPSVWRLPGLLGTILRS